ncbi:MAG: hypothetical protein M3Z27_03025 [Actinomycetota bacterium]|nr:hypothetical protein [Actinomycetota bacterium]
MAPEERELVDHLEPDQLVADRARPLPPSRLRRRTDIALWGLRIAALALSAMVIYTFVSQLGH